MKGERRIQNSIRYHGLGDELFGKTELQRMSVVGGMCIRRQRTSGHRITEETPASPLDHRELLDSRFSYSLHSQVQDF